MSLIWVPRGLGRGPWRGGERDPRACGLLDENFVLIFFVLIFVDFVSSYFMKNIFEYNFAFPNTPVRGFVKKFIFNEFKLKNVFFTISLFF